MSVKFEWHEYKDSFETNWYCFTKECIMSLHPRRPGCDRGRWIAYVHDFGHPTNPREFDQADLFPRYYMNLERAKDELSELLGLRGYTPTPPRWTLLEREG